MIEAPFRLDLLTLSLAYLLVENDPAEGGICDEFARSLAFKFDWLFGPRSGTCLLEYVVAPMVLLLNTDFEKCAVANTSKAVPCCSRVKGEWPGSNRDAVCGASAAVLHTTRHTSGRVVGLLDTRTTFPNLEYRCMSLIPCPIAVLSNNFHLSVPS